MTTSASIDFTKFRYLNIGGGNFNQREDGWLNLDYPFEAMEKKRDFTNIDIAFNLMEGETLPISDNSLDVVYTEHAMEHLPEKTVRFIFSEAHRVLKNDGVFRVSVPDAAKCWNALVNEDFTLEEYPSCWRPKGAANSKSMCFLDAVCTPLRRIINEDEFKTIVGGSGFYNAMHKIYEALEVRLDMTAEIQSKRPGDHLSWWDHVTLSSCLSHAGFYGIIGPMGCRESRHEALRADYIDRTQHKWSIRVEGVKHERFSG